MQKFYSIIFVVILATAAVMKVGQYTTDHGQVVFDKEKIKVEVVNQIASATEVSGKIDDVSLKHGVLYVFNKPSEINPWLKDIALPADIIWIQNGEIIDIAPSLPSGGQELLSSYEAPKPATHILEIGAGFVAKYGLKVGDKLEINE